MSSLQRFRPRAIWPLTCVLQVLQVGGFQILQMQGLGVEPSTVDQACLPASRTIEVLPAVAPSILLPKSRGPFSSF